MSKNTLKNHYDRKYSSDKINQIDSIKKVNIPRSRFEAVAKFFPTYFNGGSILEFGAGNGRVAKHLLEENIGISNYCVTDLSLIRMEVLKEKFQDERMSILELDIESFSETDLGQFDAIIMIALIEHLIDPLGAMTKIRGLLKPGGFVYIDTPNIAKYSRRIKLLFGHFPSTASMNEGLTAYDGGSVELYDEGHLHYFTYRSLSLMLKNYCGYSRVQKLGYLDDRIRFGKIIDSFLISKWPEFFSELAIIAYK